MLLSLKQEDQKRVEKGDICIKFDNDEPIVVGGFDLSKGSCVATFDFSFLGNITFEDHKTGKKLVWFGREHLTPNNCFNLILTSVR
jgi:hypothetical protein